MDLITHAALSAAAGAALASPLRVRAAAAAGAAAGLLPDADILIRSASDPLLNLEFHRHFTHSLAFAPLGAAVAAGIVWLLLRRRLRFGPLYGPAIAGYLAALLLDACTSYGTHLLWPFTPTPVAWSLIAVFDPVFTLLVAAPLAFGVARRRRALVRLSLVLAAAGLALGFVQHQRATDRALQLAAERGHQPQLLLVKPTLANMILWRSLYLHAGTLYADGVRVGLPGNITVYPGESAPRFDPGHDLDLPGAARARRDVERFVAFTGDLAVRHPQQPDFIGDARYAMLPTSMQPLWGIALESDSADPGVRFETRRSLTPQVRQQFVAMLLGRAPAPVR